MTLAGELAGSHPVTGALATARELLSGVSGRPLWSLSDAQVGELIEAAAALEAQVAQLKLALVAEAHGRHVAGRVAAASTQTWLRGRTRVTPAAAKGQVILAAALTSGELDPTWEALSTGRISVAHAQVIARTRGAPRC